MLLQISPFGSLNIDRERNKIFICMHSEYWVFIIPSQICTSRKTLLIDWIPFLSYHLLLQIRDIWIQISFSRGWFVWEQKSNAWVMTRRRQQAFAVWSRAAPQPASLAIFWQLSAVTLSEWNTSSDGLSGEGLHRLRTSPCVFFWIIFLLQARDCVLYEDAEDAFAPLCLPNLKTLKHHDSSELHSNPTVLVSFQIPACRSMAPKQWDVIAILILPDSAASLFPFCATH